MTVPAFDRLVKKSLDRHLSAPVYRFDKVLEPRDRRGRIWSLKTLMVTLFLGLVAGCRSLREVEDLTQEAGPTGRRYLPKRVPDTTLQNLLVRLLPPGVREQLRWQVKTLARSKRLDPVGLPCGVIAVDGKTLDELDHDAGGAGQKAHRTSDGTPYWLPRVLRAVLCSAQSKPAIDQMVVPPTTNEMGAFPAFFAALVATYQTLFEIVTLDAGFTSLFNATLIDQAQVGYVMALKETQPELLAEARRLLLPLAEQASPSAQTPWERSQGRWIQRRLYRSAEIAGYHGWSHLRQVWLVRQVSRTDDGHVTVEDRFFLTNLTTGRLKPDQILRVIRGHWGIENDCFWSLDAEFREDDHPWATGGQAVEVLGLLRLMAYNLLQYARKRSLARRDQGDFIDLPSWRQIFRWVGQALRLPLDPPAGPRPAD